MNCINLSVSTFPSKIEFRTKSVPFQYFCVTDHDSVDLTSVPWKGKYDAKELDNLYTGNHHRVSLIADRLEHYCTDLNKVKAVGFCNSVDHARFMSDEFNKRGLKSTYLVSGKGITTTDRQQIKKELSAGKVNYVFVRDIYNEGVDIPSINTVLFLRPTESLTIFLQQLGRGLRLDEGKECLTVLDFVGQAHQNYHFTERKFRAVLGRNTATLQNLSSPSALRRLYSSMVEHLTFNQLVVGSIPTRVSVPCEGC